MWTPAPDGIALNAVDRPVSELPQPATSRPPRRPVGQTARRSALQAPGAPPLPDAQTLLRQIAEQSNRLSPQLRTVARYVERHHDCLVLERIQDVADRCQVQPSAVVRFAKHFGLPGFDGLRRALGQGSQPVSAGAPACPNPGWDSAGPAQRGAEVARASLQTTAAGLAQLQRDLHLSVLADAVTLLNHARVLWITGAHRGFAVAAHLAWAFQQGRVPVQFLSLMGGLQAGQLRGVRPGDVMLAVSLGPQANETLEAAQLARARGGRLLVLTDQPPGTLVAEADLTLRVDEPASLGVAGVCNSLATAQALAEACLAAG